MLFIGSGIGPQWINKYEELSNIHLGNKYQIGAEIEFSNDFLRKRRPAKLGLRINYGVYYAYEKISFQTYYDSSMAQDFSHTLILKRMIPTFSLKLIWNAIKFRPYLQLGMFGRNIFLRKHVTVSKGGQLYYSNGNFDSTPAKTIIVATLLYAIPGAAILIPSMPYCEIGFCMPRYPNISVSGGLHVFDYMVIFGPGQKNYIQINYPLNSEQIFLMRSTILFKLKMRLK